MVTTRPATCDAPVLPCRFALSEIYLEHARGLLHILPGVALGGGTDAISPQVAGTDEICLVFQTFSNHTNFRGFKQYLSYPAIEGLYDGYVHA